MAFRTTVLRPSWPGLPQVALTDTRRLLDFMVRGVGGVTEIGLQTLSPTSIVHTGAFGAHKTAFRVYMAGAAPTTVVGVPSVGIPVGIHPQGIVSAAVVAKPVVRMDQTLGPVIGIPPTGGVGTPGAGSTLPGIIALITRAQEPVPYLLGRPPNAASDPDLIRFLMQELQKLKSTVDDLRRYVPADAIEEPVRPHNYMIRFARQPWDPLGTTPADSGWVYWNGTAWQAL